MKTRRDLQWLWRSSREGARRQEASSKQSRRLQKESSNRWRLSVREDVGRFCGAIVTTGAGFMRPCGSLHLRDAGTSRCDAGPTRSPGVLAMATLFDMFGSNESPIEAAQAVSAEPALAVFWTVTP